MKHTILALVAFTVSAYADFTSIADLAANDVGYIAAALNDNLPEQAAVALQRISVTAGGPSTYEQWAAALSQPDVQELLAAAVPVILNTPSAGLNIYYEGVVRDWLKTTAGQAWAADHSAQVSSFLSNSGFQHLHVFNDYNTPEKFSAWKAAGYARPLGEVVRPETIAFIAGMNGDWDAITALDRESFTYAVFVYELYSKWAKAQAAGKTMAEQYAFVQSELVNVGMAGTAASLPIVEHLNKLSQMMFNMIRQNAALQTP